MPRNRKLVLVFLIIFTLIFSFMVYMGLEKDILNVDLVEHEQFHHHNNYHHTEEDDSGMQFYILDILNHPWNNPNYRANLFLQILLILVVDMVFLIFIFVLDKPRHYGNAQKNDTKKI